MKTFVLFALCVAVASAAAVTKQKNGDETSDGKDVSGDYVDRETILKAIKEHGFYSYIDELGDLRQISSIPEDFDPEAYRIPKHQSEWIDE